MRDAAASRQSGDISSPDRLVQAVLDLWATYGYAGVSVRSIAQATGLPVSSIYHHFGDIERLFLAAQDQARAIAERWCEAHLDAIADAPDLGPDALPALMAALIDDWSHEQRRLAFAWRECQLMAARDASHLPALTGWHRLWAAFWQEVCDRCGVSAFGRVTHLLFDGESLLHLMQWRRAIDRACLEETCHGWSGWLTGRLVPEGPWRRFARTEASRMAPPLSVAGVVAEQIAAAAADSVAERGVGGLTHRAVAGRTGLSLGVVSYNFRTSADLLRAAFEMIYRRVSASYPGGAAAAGTGEEGIQLLERMSKENFTSAGLLALDELLIAAARDPALKPLSAPLRYLRGQTSGGVLAAMIGGGQRTSPLDAALFSSLSTGQRRACLGMTREDAQSDAQRNMLLMLDTLGAKAA